MGEDASRSAPRTPAPDQVLIQQVLSARHATFWLQTTRRDTALAGATVTIFDTMPLIDPYNVAAVEVRGS